MSMTTTALPSSPESGRDDHGMERLSHMRSVTTAITQKWNEDASGTLVA
jgi:hypothetical protein